MHRNRAVISLSVAVAALLGGCTKANPRSCADGTCSEAEFPFCDVDGALGGVPNACISVECTAGEHVACRGDNAITCDSSGGDYDLVQCPLGCSDAAGGCKECTTTSQCDNPAPICDEASSQCRQCRTDDECPSLVCDAGGTCMDESRIIYAARAGTGQCSRTQPCTLSQAVALANMTSPTPILRMLPETFTSSLLLGQGHTLSVVATGASIFPADASPAIAVRDGASLSIRGIRLVQEVAVDCTSTVTARSVVSIRDASIFALGNSKIVNLAKCAMDITAANIEMNGNEVPVVLEDDASFVGDRVFFHGNNSHSVFASGSRIAFTLTNSLLVDVGFSLLTSDTGPPGSTFTFAEDTFVLTADFSLQQGCAAASFRKVRYENAIIAPLGTFDAVTGTNCTFTNTLLSHQSSAPAGTSVADPQFVSPSTGDFHLMAMSPALNSTSASLYGLDSIIDLDGVARPQGAKADLGAYERSE